MTLVSIGAGAQGYPAKSIRFIVPFPPGGATDVVTRVVAQKLNEQYKRQVAVVDNRGGAGGVVGSELAARAAPDGYYPGDGHDRHPRHQRDALREAFLRSRQGFHRR